MSEDARVGKPALYKWLGRVYEEKGLYHKAVESYLKTDEFTSLGPEAGTALRRTYATSGWNGYWRKALELKKEQATIFPYVLAENYARLGEKDQAFFWLEKAYEEHKWFITTLNADPTFADFRSDPRYISLVRRMGALSLRQQGPTNRSLILTDRDRGYTRHLIASHKVISATGTKSISVL